MDKHLCEDCKRSLGAGRFLNKFKNCYLCSLTNSTILSLGLRDGPERKFFMVIRTALGHAAGEWGEVSEAKPVLKDMPHVGSCEFCEKKNVLLVARLKADPDQLVCEECLVDPRIPTEPLPGVMVSYQEKIAPLIRDAAAGDPGEEGEREVLAQRDAKNERRDADATGTHRSDGRHR